MTLTMTAIPVPTWWTMEHCGKMPKVEKCGCFNHIGITLEMLEVALPLLTSIMLKVNQKGIHRKSLIDLQIGVKQEIWK